MSLVPRLVPDSDIRAYLPTLKLSDAQLSAINLLVSGWLRSSTGATALPDPLPPTHPLYSAAFELIALTAVNPEGLASVTNGPTTRTFPTDERRTAILAGITSTAETATGLPVGVFPDPEPWPEPATFPRRSAW